jgi:hypothetical protein
LRSEYCKRLPVVSDEYAMSFQTHFCKWKSSIRTALTFVYGDRGEGFAGDSVVASAAGATVAASSAGWLLPSLDGGSRLPAPQDLEADRYRRGVHATSPANQTTV